MGLRAPARGAAHCAWLPHDINQTDPERMVDVERSMRNTLG
jgi:hypothetical protein